MKSSSHNKKTSCHSGMRNLLKKLLLLSQFIGILFFASCKNGEIGSMKTLENLESLGPLEFTECHGANPLHPKAARLNLPAHLRAAVQAVPMNLQQSFFDDLKGSIEINNDLAGICWQDSNQLPTREDDITGCVRHYGNDSRPLVIHVLESNPVSESSRKRESYDLVLRFGFIWADQVNTRDIPPIGNVGFYNVTGGPIGAIHQQLTLAFLEDVASRGPSGAKSIANFGIPRDVTLASNPANRETNWNRLPQGLRDDFAKRVAAETFHSHFCSVSTRKSMEKRFPATSNVFTEMARDLEGREPTVGADTKVLASSTRSGWYETYGQLARSRNAAGQDAGISARITLASQIEGGAATKFHLFDLQQMLPFLIQGLSGLMSGGDFDPTSFINQLIDGGPLPTPSNAPILSKPPTLPTPNAPASGDDISDIDPEARIAFEEGNKYRQQHGLPPHKFSRVIYDECVAQAQAQVAQGMKHWLVPHPNSSAENIAYGQRTGVIVAKTWYESPGHRANLLGRYTTSAVGHVRNQWCHRFR